jgi:AAA15 family ATPase/GTPase
MDIIEKIEIKHFRSFDGGKDQAKVKIDDLKDLNIFSGANDSGKSNVLRALNLFFNDEISPGIKFNKDRDFSKIVANRFDEDIEKRKAVEAEKIKKLKKIGVDEMPRDLRRSDEVISIKLFFNNEKQQRGLPKKFWISKSYSQQNNFEGEYIYQTDLKGSAQVTLFLNSFKFEYVPAIKDKTYFSHLFEKLQSYLFEKEDKKKENKFSKSSDHFNQMLQSETKELFQKFLESTGVDANFHIPSTLVDFFRTLAIRTENDISLFDRGDGVQARFIPEILDEISKNTKRNIIWGFEEPENSYEVKNIRKIRDEFIGKYSKGKQIFITSHTKEFLSIKRKYTQHENSILNNPKLSTKAKISTALKNLKIEHSSSDVSIYRVWKNEDTNNASFITRFDETNNEWEKTCDDLGVIQEARIIEDLQDALDLQAKEIKKSQLSQEKQKKVYDELCHDLKKSLAETESVKIKIEEYQKPILVVEDKLDAIYKIAYLKVKDVPFAINEYKEKFAENCPFAIRRAECAGAVSGKLRMNNTDGYEDKKIIGLFDFDEEGTKNFYHLKDGANWDDKIHGEKDTGIYKRRNNHGCFYGLLLPVPHRHLTLVGDIKNGGLEGLVEIENLFSDEILKTNKLVTQEKKYSLDYLKIKKDVKPRLQQLLPDLDKGEFDDFVPLYNKIEELFGI